MHQYYLIEKSARYYNAKVCLIKLWLNQFEIDFSLNTWKSATLQIYVGKIFLHCDTHFHSRYLEKLSNVSPNCILRFNAITQTWFNPICYLRNKDFSRSHRGSVFYFQMKCDLTHTLACKSPFYTSFLKIHVVVNLILSFKVSRTHHNVGIIKIKNNSIPR